MVSNLSALLCSALLCSPLCIFSYLNSILDLHAQAMKSKIFLLFYQWIFILSIMNLITSLCALRVEMTELLNLKTQLQRAQNIR
jgi:hypothetical protein